MRQFALPLVLMLVLVSCARGAGGAQTRTVLVDFSHDEFATFFLEYFPRSITVRPGDTVEFEQTWTGEPHSVTMGTLVDQALNVLKPFIQRIREGEPFEQIDQELPEERVNELFAALPPMTKGFGYDMAQNGAQPCYLDEGTPPTDPDTPCSEEQQRQPAFNGRQSYYNSGYIHYAGPQGNTFTVELADDIAPGTYNFYCNLHGPLQSGEIVVTAPGSEIPSQADVNRQARDEIEEMAAPLRSEFEKAQQGRLEIPEEARPPVAELGALNEGRFFSGNLGGLFAFEDQTVHGGISEFIPRTITARVGEKVSWFLLGLHTVSFDVPRFFPIVEVRSDGSVEANPRIGEPAGGSPALPEEGPPEGEGPPPPPLTIDGGSWDGSGFFSSGLIGGDPFAVYSLTFMRAGSYRYACLIHPKMVGTVEVT